MKVIRLKPSSRTRRCALPSLDPAEGLLIPTLLAGNAEKKLRHFYGPGVSRVLAYCAQLLDRLQALLAMAFFAGTALSDPAGGARPQDQVCQSLQ